MVLAWLTLTTLGQRAFAAPPAQESSSAQTTPAAIPAPDAKVHHRIVHDPESQAGKAEAAILKSDWKTAEPLLDAWIAAHPDDSGALFDAAYVADAENRSDDAIALYRRALTVDEAYLEADVSLGLLLARLDRFAEARPVLEAATTLIPSPDVAEAETRAKAKAWRALAHIDLTRTDIAPDPQQASIDLLEALKLSPETVADTLMAAHIAEISGETAAAEAAYRRALSKDAHSGAAIAGLAHLLILQKKYPDAEALLRDALKSAPAGDPGTAALTAQLAAALVAQDKPEALPLLQDFHTKHPDDPAMTRMLAQVEADGGDYAESDRLYLTLLAASPNDSDLLAGHGQNLIRLRRFPEAVKAFQRATDLDETNGEAWNGLAFAAFETHQPSVTLHALTVRSKYLPENATIYFLWATAYDTLHDKKQAVAYYHHFLDTAAGKLPDQEWQARQRLALLEKTP
jgi:tetratricopeptide (TPR) repeat protein